MINARLLPDAQAVLTPGEAVAGMILNGWGFAQRPLSLTPQFFANKPLDLWFREGLEAELFNRVTLGRRRDDASTYGCDVLLQELALALWAQEGSDQRFKHRDTTSFALTGAYVPDSEEHAMTITHGDAKDHRPDLQQVVLELMVSQDGGVPYGSNSWDGNTSDIHVFQERAQALMTAFEPTPSPRYLVADATLYHADNAPYLKHSAFLTRILNTLGVVSQVIRPALTGDTWHPIEANIRSQRREVCHYGMAQRWLVVDSQAAFARAAAMRKKATQREEEAITKTLFHLQAQRFPTPEAAPDALAAVAQRWQYHQVESSHLTEHTRYAGTGRPTPPTPRQASAWQIQARGRPADDVIGYHQPVQAWVVLGPNINASELSDSEGIAADKSQSRVEGGFRFLTDPLFFVASLFVKKPRRIDGLWMVMTLALLVYSVTQRRLRQQVAEPHQTVPNQIHQPTTSPTLRWGFQLLEGIHRVRVTVQGHVYERIESLTDVPINILRLFGNEVCHLYHISPV